MVKFELLRKVYLFETLTEVQLESIAEVAIERDVIAGDYVFDEGAVASSLFIIKQGSVEIAKKSESGEERAITTISAGSHFGEMAFIDKMNRAASAMTRENTKLVEIKYDVLDRILNSDLEIGVKVYRAMAMTLCKRIRQTTGDLSTLRDLKLRGA